MATFAAPMPLAQQMDAEEPDAEARLSDSFDPVCNFYAYDGNERQCLYDVCCVCCVYGDNRVVDELIQGLPATLDTPEARALQLGQRTKTPVCCLPGCTRHCLILSAGSLPYLIGRLSGCFSPTHNIPLCCLFNCTSIWWTTIVGGLNRQRLKDKFKITQPKCSLLGCPIERMEALCCWFWNPLVWGQEARYLRRKFERLAASEQM